VELLLDEMLIDEVVLEVTVLEGLFETASTPPTAPPGGLVDVEAFWARAMNALRVLPTAGAFIAPTIPDWQ